MTVAIDGPAGVGKSTVARRCADEFGFSYLNSGNLYRAVTYAHLSAGRDPNDNDLVVRTAQTTDVSLRRGRYVVDGEDVTDDLHSDAVDAWVAQHSAIVAVRHLVNSMLKRIATEVDVVVEGRDMTTVVFPDAEVKVYLDASIDVRAQRRFDQGTSSKSLKELRENIAMRDQIDSNKQEGSLKVAPEAWYIDTSRLTIEEVCEKVAKLIRSTKTRDTKN